MSAYGMTATVLATQLAEAVLKDESIEEGGFDLSAGMFGRNVSDWIREIAKEFNEKNAEIERLRAEIDEIKQVEFPRRVQKIANVWRGKVDALQAKIKAMEQQKPVAEVAWAADIPNTIIEIRSLPGYSEKIGDKLYLATGAQTTPNVQEPVARFNWRTGKVEWLQKWDFSTMNMRPLYLAAGAEINPSAEFKAGIESAAQLAEAKAIQFAEDKGYEDSGCLLFGHGFAAQTQMGYYEGLLDLVDELRKLTPGAQTAPSVQKDWNLEAEIHKVAKRHMSKKAQGHFMESIRTMLTAAPGAQAAPNVQEPTKGAEQEYTLANWKPHPQCDEACFYVCSEGNTKSPQCAQTASSVPDGWQPIETAPKDGTHVLLTFVSEDGTKPLFSAAASYVPRAGDTVTYSMEAPANERQEWNEEAWNEKRALSGKEWTVVSVHHDFRKFSVRTPERQVLYVYVRPSA